ncbi:MAG: type II toxin-antitoxin system VapC family toxin [Nitrososphaeraceae archaeon]
MKKRLYFDTSAIIKEFVNEVGSELIDKVTTSAREGHLQVVSSVWSINEALAVIDRKYKKNEITQVQIQTVISTFAKRMIDSSQKSNFFFAPLDHTILVNSREAIKDFHISPSDALHLYTGWVYDCACFLVQDRNFVKQIPMKQYKDVKIIDLAFEADRKYLETEIFI